MDIITLGAILGIVKKMPDTAAGSATRAEDAADRAEAAATIAEAHGYALTIEGTGLVITSEQEGS